MLTTYPNSAARALRIDILRGIAVFGILLVNVWSFIWGFETLRYGVLDADASIFDVLSIAFVAFFAEQKFYPVFAFLFGAGFVFFTRSIKRRLGQWSDAERIFRRRLGWLLLCGILHGTLIWFGDILTVYAIVGFWVLSGLAGARLRQVRNNLRLWLIIFFVLLLFHFALGLMVDPATLTDQAKNTVAAVEASRLVYTQGSFWIIGMQRISDYLMVTMQSLFILPHIAVLFLLGVTSVRRGWLTQPWRHQTFWRRVRWAGLVIGVPFNLAWATTVLTEAIDPLHPSLYAFPLYVWLPVGGTCLAAAYVASIMLAGDRLANCMGLWLAPVGRMALTHYLMQSVICAVLMQGFGLGLGASWTPAGWVGIAFGVMAFQLMFSRWWLARHARGPLESLLHTFVYRQLG